jgi:4'-phosphopantetheinyl transferase
MTPTPEHEWTAQTESRILLAPDEVHIWRTSLNQGKWAVRASLDILSHDERRRADKFYFERDREHFIVGRGVLKKILSRYLEVSPERISFAYNQYGKPALSAEAGDQHLRFNVSHSHGLALYAFARGREVGIDIEFAREDFASLEIAGHFFSPQEVATLRALPASELTRAFFNCWTRKEAFIKALGEGLSHPLDTFAVSLKLGAPASLLSVDGLPQEAARWSLMELFPGEGYVAALAVEGEMPVLRYTQWDEFTR